MSLRAAQRNYAGIGACEAQFGRYVRKPVAIDQRDEGWRPLDPAQDHIEDQRTVALARSPNPDDLTALYYWRETYWRRQPSERS